MVGTPHVIGAAQELQAAVVTVAAVQGHHAAHEMREQAAVVVPVAVVLVPLPGAAAGGILGRELRLEVIDGTAEQRLGGIHHALAARREPVDAVTRAVPERNLGRTALAVRAIQYVVAHGGILLHGPPQQLGLLGVEHAARIDESIATVGGKRIRAQYARHGTLR